MSKHNRRRNKRHTNSLLAVFNKMCQLDAKERSLGLTLSLTDLITYRLENTGKFPGYTTPEQREAYKRFAR